MTLDPATDIDHWARERARPMMEEPDGADDIERWLHWADLRTARTLPEETAPREGMEQSRGPQHGPGQGGHPPADPGQAPHEGGRPGRAGIQPRSPDHRERLPRCHLACQHPASLGHSPGPGPQRRSRTRRRRLKALPAPTENSVPVAPSPRFRPDRAWNRQSMPISTTYTLYQSYEYFRRNPWLSRVNP